ncbi:MAG TPA: UdgX family uracil-DNA binding protein [Candidatus Limnocylindrales bacterium]|nr:UdgX family uracil-DNA binding protein [Candidatus Limnocylindrales bacterium]
MAAARAEAAGDDPATWPANPALALSPDDGVERIRQVASGCRACDLWRIGTRTVFGEGALSARLMLVGEQPGDREDLAGRPFVGPAGALLERALDEAGIDRQAVFVTNVVKHFKWRPSGRRRLHERPSRAEVRACRPWLDLELELVTPAVVVALGATAAGALFGPAFRLTEQRGVPQPAADGGPIGLATFHPSAVLRARDDTRTATFEAIVRDLRTANTVAAG